jgi:hypothetical protein
MFCNLKFGFYDKVTFVLGLCNNCTFKKKIKPSFVHRDLSVQMKYILSRKINKLLHFLLTKLITQVKISAGKIMQIYFFFCRSFETFVQMQYVSNISLFIRYKISQKCYIKQKLLSYILFTKLLASFLFFCNHFLANSVKALTFVLK